MATFITIETTQKGEDQIKAEIVESIKKEIQKLRETDPKKCKESKRALSILETMTPESLEIATPEVELITDMEAWGSIIAPKLDYAGDPTKEFVALGASRLTLKFLNFNRPIYLMKNAKNPKQHERVYNPIGENEYSYYPDHKNYRLEDGFENAYKKAFLNENPEMLRRYSEDKINVYVDRYKIIKTEPVEGFSKTAVVWNLKNTSGTPVKIQITKFDKSKNHLMIYFEGLLRPYATTSYGDLVSCDNLACPNAFIDAIKKIFKK